MLKFYMTYMLAFLLTSTDSLSIAQKLQTASYNQKVARERWHCLARFVVSFFFCFSSACAAYARNTDILGSLPYFVIYDTSSLSQIKIEKRSVSWDQYMAP